MRILISILCFIYVVLINAQNTNRFPINPAGVWKMRYNGSYNEIFEFYINSDTLLNFHKYYKLYKSGVAYYDTPFYYNGIYVGALRDENNKFFYIEEGETSEVQLFDFDLELGDTIQGLIGKSKIINQIDTLPDGRKRYGRDVICVVSCPFIQIIEGIGHAGGIMNDPPNFHAGLAGYKLICYMENEEVIYHNNFGVEDTGCEQNISVQKALEIKTIIKIFPVPFKDIVTIELLNFPIGAISIEIYNMQGIQLLNKNLDNQNNLNKIYLDLTGFKKGFYLVKIFNKSAYITKPLIVE